MLAQSVLADGRADDAELHLGRDDELSEVVVELGRERSPLALLHVVELGGERPELLGSALGLEGSLFFRVTSITAPTTSTLDASPEGGCFGPDANPTETSSL